MVFCIQNEDFSTRIAGIYGSQPSSEVFACKAAPFGSELQVSMGPSHHLWFCAFKTATELLVSMDPSPHLVILHAKRRLLDQNYKSLWVPALIWGFFLQNRAFSTRIASLYGSQPSSEVFACKTPTFGSELQVSMGPSHHLWFCALKTATELLVSMDPSPHLGILHAKRRLLDQNYKSLWVPALIWGFCLHNSAFSIRIASLYGSQPSSEVFACKIATFG